MRVLIYKRTHTGDPDERGIFGTNDCMGSIRRRNFDAVIGIGGIGAEPLGYGIGGKLNWIGLGAQKMPNAKFGLSKPNIVFDHFLLRDHRGQELALIAPRLSRHMYDRNRRVVMSDSLPSKVMKEVMTILNMAEGAPKSQVRSGVRAKRKKCASKTRRKCR